LEQVVDGVEYLWEVGTFQPILNDVIDSGCVVGLERWTGYSIERINPGYDTNNSSVDFVILNRPTPGSQHLEKVEGSGRALLPYSIRLFSNYPNPFNSGTVIPFEIGNGSSGVRLMIVDVLGRMVRDFQLGNLEAGNHSVTWDGNSAGGIPVASGIYFVTLQKGNIAVIKTMTLVR
jgi:hypothetical protein